jgi:hypothetical protein
MKISIYVTVSCFVEAISQPYIQVLAKGMFAVAITPKNEITAIKWFMAESTDLTQ